MSSAAPPSTAPLEKLIIESRSGWRAVALGELWRYRELLWILAMRDVCVRYKQTMLGALWAIIQPLFTTIVFVLIAQLGKLGTDGLPARLLIMQK